MLTGAAKPTGKLPVELPRSMAAVQRQLSDVPTDTAVPLHRIGYGLTF